MLNDASGFRRIYLATDYTDLRRGMEALHPSSSLIFSWIRIRKISCSCSAEGGLTVSKGWSGKAMVSYSYTKDWNWAHLTGPARKKKHWRSHRSSTSISCRDLKLLHAIRSRKSDRGKSYKVLCKTEKIKKYLPVIISSEKKLSTFHDPLSSFIKEYFQAIYGACG